MTSTQVKPSPEGVPGAVSDPSSIVAEELAFAGAGGRRSTATSPGPRPAARTPP